MVPVADAIGLYDLLRHGRRRTLRGSIPDLPKRRLAAGLPAVPRTGARERGLTQQDMDVLLYRAPGSYYSRLERGMITEPPADVLRQIARLLGFDEREWGALWLSIYGQQPSPTAALHPGEASAVPPIWRTVVMTSPLIAYVNDLGWDVIYSNSAAEAVWGVMPENVMMWILTDTAARDRIMIDWSARWAPLAVSQLVNAVREHPHHPRLLEIRELALHDNEVHRLWETRRDPYLHPDGDRRRILHATEQRVMIMDSAVGEPKAAPGCRIVFMHCRPETP